MENVPVVIIGAGVAGISAAQHLFKKGCKNITVLEAGSRWGGRVRTESFGDSLVEIGANWIHGGSLANPVFNLANQRAGELLFHKGKMHRLTRRTGFYYTSSGKCIDADLGLECFDKFFALERKATDLYLDPKAKEESFASFVEKEYPRLMEGVPEAQREDAENIFWGMTNYLNFHGGDALDKCSAKQYGSFWDIPGGDIKIPGGYINVFKDIYTDIQEFVRFNRKVTLIDWSVDGKVKITSEQTNPTGSDRKQEIVEAAHVIVTVPLGNLKKNHGEMFTPGLPEDKVAAMNRIGFGRVGKIFLEFEAPFWAEGEEAIKLAWTKEEIQGATFPQEWYKSILGFDEVINNRRVLVSWISGDGAEAMEKLSESEVKATLGDLLRRCTGDHSLPDPISAKKTGWISNPLFLGTYTYPSTESSFPSDITTFSVPLGSSVLFAGEATSEKGYSTVHGARWSGIKEANRIIQLANKK